MKRFKLFSASVLIVFSAAACSSETTSNTPSASTSVEPSAAPKEVTLKIGLPGSYDITSKKIIDGFEAKYPNIKLQIEEAPWADFTTKIVTNIAGNNAPDIWFQENAVILGYGTRGVAENLEPYIKRDLKTEDYIDSLLSAKTPDGKIYGIPHGVNPIALVYNKKLFQENNVPFPTDDWTYQDMIDTAKKLTKDTDGDGKTDIYGFQTASSITQGWIPWIKASGGSALDAGLTKATFTDPNTIEGLTRWSDTILKDKISPTREMQTNQNYFQSEQTAMTFLQYSGQINLNKNKPDLDWDVVKVPIGFNGKRFVPVVVNQWLIYSKAKPEAKEAAWTFLKYYLSDEAQTFLSESGASLPVKKTTLEALEKSTGKPANKQAFTKGVEEAGGTLDENPSWNEWRAAATPILNDILDGKISPTDGAKEIQQKVQSVLDENK
ncbi:carbohydrate ABC transporter substrate-binding protein (CUT1 family) [Paenibacillus sp. BK033]|uniref:ABC transporter substrate-binding protein n=1 Tax=Paenibacillus sp. BK033 TaxID=2512133 RepID=UPI0010439AC1|nr:sugar ABC transporter substrate-binding protein [Paenibacillus sp. BK033]TCM98722.1 carbohydrate ABC transporter substrate-binding protein (CUT1 family) [Paenibacillus sp. BK033]